MTEPNLIPPIEHTELTPQNVTTVRPTAIGTVLVVKKFNTYKHKMTKTWEVYSFNAHYLLELHPLINDDKLEELKIDNLYNSAKYKYNKKDLFGIINHSIIVVNPKRALIELVGLTEHYLQELTYIVYKEFPQRLDSYQSKDEQNDRQQKLLSIILESSDKDEIINKIIEEKVRNIFYGNPIEFFTKDKAKIGIGKFFEQNHLNSIKKYKEIIALRNILIHNDGRIDRKYLREVENSAYKLGNKVTIEKEYIREAVLILSGFACIVTKIVLQNTFQSSFIDKKLLKMYQSFHKVYNDPSHLAK